MAIKSLKDLQKINVEAVAQAIEADAGHKVAGIRQALQEAKEGKGSVHTPQGIAAYKRKHQDAYERHQIQAGAARIPSGMLSPEAAKALAKIMAKGAPSKVAAINQALIAAAQLA